MIGSLNARVYKVLGTIILVSMMLSACDTLGERISPVLEPKENPLVWPKLPEKARFADSGTLIGEADFLADKNRKRDKTFWEIVVGILFGPEELLELQRPVMGMIDPLGRMLVTDVANQAVIVFDFPQAKVEKWSMISEFDQFVMPIGIAPDGETGVWVCDSELGIVVHLDQEGHPLEQIGKGILKRPTGIARFPETGDLYVVDTEEHNIKVFTSNGVFIDVIGRRGLNLGEFNAPTHIAIKGGKIYVSDTLNFRVQVLNEQGDGQRSFGQLGRFIGNMTRPKGVAVGRDGRVYVIESYYDHLLVYDKNGRFLMPIGGTGNEVGTFYLPNGVWTDENGRVYVADMFNGRVSVFKELNDDTRNEIGGP